MQLKILFIGNSHTYLHKMPWIIAELADAGSMRCAISVGQCTGTGVGLKDHWHDRKTRDTIANKTWDTIVLQDRSGGPLEDSGAFKRYAALFDNDIKHNGADTLFYMTWAHRKRPEDQKTIARLYMEAAHRHHAGLVPVGTAWRQSIREKPELNLYHKDGRHAGPAGAYLTACVFYAVLFNTSPAGLPSQINIQGKPRVNLDEKNALYLQQIAFQTVRRTKDSRKYGDV